MNENDLAFKIYSSGLTEISDWDGSLRNARIEPFSTIFPGGRCASARIFVPRDPTHSWAVKKGQRVAIYNSLRMIWEGKINEIAPVLTGNENGQRLECVGKWGGIFSRTWNKRWADQRLTPDVWVQQASASANDRCTLDRTGRLRITPNGASFAAGDYFAVRYTMPTGQLVKKVKTTYTLDEVAKTQPARAKYESADVFTPLPLAIDSNATTYETISWVMGDRLYVGVENPDSVSGFRFTGMRNVATATLTAFYRDDAGGWTALTITDGTADSGRTMFKDGDVTFTRPENWLNYAVGGSRQFFYVRFQISANLTASLHLNEIVAIDPQAWEIRLWNVTTAASESTISATGTGELTVTLATPTQSIELRFVATASQTCPTNGSVYGQYASLLIYSETDAITPTKIVKDVRAHCADINADENSIDSNTFALTPFITNGAETLASILQRTAAVGDASFNPWDVYLTFSDRAATLNGLPVLSFSAYGVLTDYDLLINLDEVQLSPPFELKQAIEGYVANWIIVKYRDELSQADVILTPDDDATLKDAVSIAAWGEQHLVIDAGQATVTTAKNYAKRVLAARKDPKYRTASPINVIQRIRAKAGYWLPACRIVAGLRVKIANYLNADLIFHITGTDYDPATQTNRLTVGQPDNIAVYLAQRALIDGRRLV